MKDLQCQICGRRFQNKTFRKTCSKDCMKKLISMSEHQTMQSKAGQKQREESSVRMKIQNPMHQPDNIEKMIETKKRNGTLNQPFKMRGGNGKYTPEQLTLFQFLSMDWILEYPIPTKIPRGNGYPTCYKVDLALPSKMLAIEVDGRAHGWKNGLLKDLKKTELLQQLGWKVLRFTNQEIKMNLSRVILEIEKNL